MNIRNQLLREAGGLASSQTARRVELAVEIGRREGRRSLSEVEKVRLDELRAMSDNCGQALPRFAGYRPHQEAVPKSPHCWIMEGASSARRAGKALETYQCGACGLDYP
jgi:hypothetical protein